MRQRRTRAEMCELSGAASSLVSPPRPSDTSNNLEPPAILEADVMLDAALPPIGPVGFDKPLASNFMDPFANHNENEELPPLAELDYSDSNNSAEFVPLHSHRYLRFPHFDTISNNYKTKLLSLVTVKAKEYIAPIYLAAAGAKANRTLPSGDPGSSLTIISPKEYALADVALYEFNELVRSTSRQNSCRHSLSHDCPHRPRCDPIEHIPILRNRNWFYGEPQAIDIDRAHRTSDLFAEESDIISIKLRGNTELSTILNSFRVDSNPNSLLICRIRHIGVVHHCLHNCSRQRDSLVLKPDLSPLLSLFTCDNYDGTCTPIDNDTDLPAEEKALLSKLEI